MRIFLILLLTAMNTQVQSKDLNYVQSEEVLTRGNIIKSSALNSGGVTDYHIIYRERLYICSVSRAHQIRRALFLCTDNQE